MAWRIEDSVVCGEIDNRTRGLVTGKIWLEGLPRPLEICLKGNACSDLAGCRLEFRNPKPPRPFGANYPFNPVQNGTVGDLTASRKVRVPEVPWEEFCAWDQSKGPAPEHMGNCLYLEWFSKANGRVVIEGVEWRLQISAPEWRLTPAEEEQRSRDAAEGMNSFMQRLTDAIAKNQRGQKDPQEDWNEHDYEKFLRECDARTEKYRELLEKYGDAEDGEDRINAAMGWNRGEDGGFLSADEWEEICEDAENARIELDPAREGIDWIKTKNGDIRHPLQHRCHESAMRFWNSVQEIAPLETAPEDLQKFVFEFQTTSAKLAGSLSGLATDRDLVDPALTVAYLKRALNHLHQAQAGLEAPATVDLLTKQLISDARQELFAIRQEILQLMDELRGRAGRE
jgi:hypothetical protein